MARLALSGLNKVYPNGTHAVQELNLEIGDGELLVLVGPSGCGKTSVLRMVAGLEEISSGTVAIDDRVINDVDESARDIAMVFQSYALYPHLSVRNNIAFPLRLARVPADERRRRVNRVASTLGLERYLDEKPSQLSGGQRQRVAMGRAIVREPRAFLMDEPLSNLDAKLRVQMRAEILDIQRRLGVTTMYVTHDQSEAMTLGDRVALLRGGRLQQVASPREIYSRPSNAFVAAFVGSPAMNLGRGRVAAEAARIWVQVGSHRLLVDEIEESMYPLVRGRVGTELIVGARPETLREADAGQRPRTIRGRVGALESLGSDVLAHVVIDGDCCLPFEVAKLADDFDEIADPSELPSSHEGAMFTARLPASATVRRGDDLSLSVEPGGLHFFDASSGAALRDDRPGAPAAAGHAVATAGDER